MGRKLFYGRPVAEIAALTGRHYNVVYKHAIGAQRVSPEMAMIYERLAGIPRYLTRPDIWPYVEQKPSTSQETSAGGESHE